MNTGIIDHDRPEASKHGKETRLCQSYRFGARCRLVSFSGLSAGARLPRRRKALGNRLIADAFANQIKGDCPDSHFREFTRLRDELARHRIVMDHRAEQSGASGAASKETSQATPPACSDGFIFMPSLNSVRTKQHPELSLEIDKHGRFTVVLKDGKREEHTIAVRAASAAN